jgi:hypothetical protein
MTEAIEAQKAQTALVDSLTTRVSFFSLRFKITFQKNHIAYCSVCFLLYFLLFCMFV